MPSSVRTADGVDLYVEEYGPADAPVTVVLLHGWTLDRRIWRHQAAELAHGARVRVLAYDHRGHGRSGATDPDRMTVAQLGDDLAVVTGSSAGPVVLAGHSIGGMAIMALAERHPRLFAERVAGVAFVNTSSGGLAEPGLGLPRSLARLAGRVETAVGRQLVSASGDGAEARGVRTAAARLAWRALVSRPGLRWLLFGRRPPRDAVRATVETVAGTRPETAVGFRATLADHERRACLATFHPIPVVVLGGTADRLCPSGHPETIAAELPDAELVLFRRAGHMLPLERPADVTHHLTAIVGRAGLRRTPY